MKRRIATGLLSLLFGLVFFSLSIRAEEGKEFEAGCIPISQEEYDKIPEAPIPVRGVTLPPRWDFSYRFPKPRNQGKQGSCAAWAVGYAYKGYQEREERFWHEDTPEQLLSPAFIYNLRDKKSHGANSLEDEGMTIVNAMTIVNEMGICTMATMPYNELDDKTQPSVEAIREAKSFKGRGYYTLKRDGTDSIVGILKAHLANNTPIILAIPMFSEFYNLGSNGDFIYSDIEQINQNTKFHAITLTGYDDEFKSFKFINSWGEDWGDRGYGYISYDFLTHCPKVEFYTLEDGGWRVMGNGWKYLEKEGYAKNKWILDLRDWYFFNEDGYKYLGWLRRGDNWYYMRTAENVPQKGIEGAMCKGWIFVNNNWYYLRPDTNIPQAGNEGAMCKGWIKVDGYWYYLRTATNVPQPGSEGAMCKGWIKIAQYWYYLRPEGNVPYGGPSGSMLENTKAVIGNKVYYFDGSGHCINP